MKLKSVIVAALMFALAGAAMAKTPVPAKKRHPHKMHVLKKHHKVKHTKKTTPM